MPIVVVIGRGLGSALFGVPVYSLPMKALVKGGMSQEDAAVPTATLMVLMPYIGICFGPAIAGLIISAYDVAGLGVAQLGLSAIQCVVLLIVCYPLLRAEPEEDATGHHDSSSTDPVGSANSEQA